MQMYFFFINFVLPYKVQFTRNGILEYAKVLQVKRKNDKTTNIFQFNVKLHELTMSMKETCLYLSVSHV